MRSFVKIMMLLAALMLVGCGGAVFEPEPGATSAEACAAHASSQMLLSVHTLSEPAEQRIATTEKTAVFDANIAACQELTVRDIVCTVKLVHGEDIGAFENPTGNRGIIIGDYTVVDEFQLDVLNDGVFEEVATSGFEEPIRDLEAHTTLDIGDVVFPKFSGKLLRFSISLDQDAAIGQVFEMSCIMQHIKTVDDGTVGIDQVLTSTPAVAKFLIDMS